MDKLNKEAEERFEKIKAKKFSLGEVFEKTYIKTDKSKLISQKFDKPQNTNQLNIQPVDNISSDEIKQDLKILDFIDSLDISNNLKIVFGFLLDSSKENRLLNLQKAKSYIEKEMEEIK